MCLDMSQLAAVRFRGVTRVGLGHTMCARDAAAFDQTLEGLRTAQHSVQSQLGPQVVAGIEPMQVAEQALGPQTSVAS